MGSTQAIGKHVFRVTSICSTLNQLYISYIYTLTFRPSLYIVAKLKRGYQNQVLHNLVGLVKVCAGSANLVSADCTDLTQQLGLCKVSSYWGKAKVTQNLGLAGVQRRIPLDYKVQGSAL